MQPTVKHAAQTNEEQLDGVAERHANEIEQLTVEVEHQEDHFSFEQLTF